MSAARDAILGRIRRAERTGRMPDLPAVNVPPAPPRSADESLERFLAELTALGVAHYVEPTGRDVRARVESLVAGRTVFSWDPAHVPYDVGSVLAGAVLGSSSRDAQASAAVGVTGCACAIAETGTLVLLTGEGRPRAASLLPPVHIAIVRRSEILFGMTEFFERRGADAAAAACCTFVTGPSRTADIELTLTIGVHGPGEVIVVVGPE